MLLKSNIGCLKVKKNKYHKYLKSYKWKQKRKQIFREYGKRCWKCGRKLKIQVHHKTYRRLGKEKKRDLKPYCSDCHEEK